MPAPSAIYRLTFYVLLLQAAWCGVFSRVASAQSQQFELTPKGLEPAAKVAAQVEDTKITSDANVIARARLLLATAKPSEAIDLLDTWIEENETTRKPSLAEAYLVRGDAHVANDDEFKSLYDYERVIQDYPGSEFFVRALERELVVAKMYLGGLRKKSLGLIRIDTGIPLAEEAIMRINERLPASRLAERALLTLADYYYTQRDLRMAAETYDVFLRLFPRSDHRKKATQRLVYANIAQFKGPLYDANGLTEAKFQIQRYQAEFPLDAEQTGMGDALVARLDESAAQQMLEVAGWYSRRGDPPAQRLTLQRLIRQHPSTGAAKVAADILTKNNWPLEVPRRKPRENDLAREPALNPAAQPNQSPTQPSTTPASPQVPPVLPPASSSSTR